MTFASRLKLSPRLIMLGAFGGTSALNYAFGVAMGWLLGPGNYGLLAFAQTLLLIGGMVTNYAFSLSLARAIVKADRPQERDAFVRGTLLINLAIAAVIATVLVALFAVGPLREGFEQWSVAVVVALSFPFISLINTIGGCAEGSSRWGILALLMLTEMLCKTMSSVALVLLGLGAFGAIAGFLVGSVCAASLGFYLLTRSLGVRLRGSPKLPDVRAAIAMLGVMLGLSMLLNLNVAGLKLLAAERAIVGYYQAGLVLSAAPYYLVMAAVVPVLFVQLARYDSVSATQKTLGESLGLTAVLILPFEIILMAFPRQALITLFPDVYAAGAPALRVLALANILLILTAIFSTVFQAVGWSKVPALILLAVTFVEPLALWVVVPRGQALGAAWVFVAAASLALSGLVVTYLWKSGVRCFWQATPWITRYLMTVGVSLAAGCVVLDLGAAPTVIVGMICYLLVASLLRIINLLSMLPGKEASLVEPATPAKE